MTRTRAAIAGGLLALVVAVLAVAAEQQVQLASTDRVSTEEFVTELVPGGRLCQANEIVPAGAAALRMTIGTYGKPGPPLRIAITAATVGSASKSISSASIPEGWRQGVVVLPVSRVSQTYGDATVCISDAGRWPVAVAGATPPAEYGLLDYVDGKRVLSEVRIDYLLPGKPSWFSMLSRIAYRMTLGKGTYVGWMGWLAPLLLMLALVGVLVRVLLREERDA